MSFFNLLSMTFGSLFKKPETIMYPFEKKPPYKGMKGHIANDVSGCILCGMCQKVCPCNCIDVDKPASTWTIEPFMCVLCGSCVRACPTKCLDMDTSSTSVASKKSIIKLDVPKKEKKEKAAKEG